MSGVRASVVQIHLIWWESCCARFAQCCIGLQLHIRFAEEQDRIVVLCVCLLSNFLESERVFTARQVAHMFNEAF